jgi:transcriptional regulator with XRE-family HTH domain
MKMQQRNSILITFGRNIRSRREARGLTQEKLAELAELDRSFISDVERGGRNISLLNIQRIAKALRTTVSELTRGLDD